MPFANSEEERKAQTLAKTFETFDDACHLAAIWARESKEAMAVIKYGDRYLMQRHSTASPNTAPIAFKDEKAGHACFLPGATANPNDKKVERLKGGEGVNMQVGGSHPAMVGLNDCLVLTQMAEKYPYFHDACMLIAQHIMHRLRQDPESNMIVDMMGLTLGIGLDDLNADEDGKE